MSLSKSLVSVTGGRRRTHATILADLKSTTGSMMFPNSSFCLLIVNVASMEAIAIQSKDKAM